MSTKPYNSWVLLFFRPRGVFRLLGWSCFCFLLLLGACADDHYTPPSAPACPQDPVCSDPPPLPGDPRYGLAAQILIQDTGCNRNNARLDCLWIGIDDPAVVDQILARGSNIGGRIRGTVIVDPSQPHGLYLDPSSTVYWGGGLIGGATTNIDWVEADPARHDGGFWAFGLHLRDMVINP